MLSGAAKKRHECLLRKDYSYKSGGIMDIQEALLAGLEELIVPELDKIKMDNEQIKITLGMTGFES